MRCSLKRRDEGDEPADELLGGDGEGEALLWRVLGATRDHDLFDWFQDVAITSSGLGLPDVAYKRNLDVVQQDRDGVTLRRWTLVRAWPVKLFAGEWDNESDENVIESVTLTFDFFELT